MKPWLSDYPAIRSLPRLWVQTVWLLESREPLAVTRTIELHPGLNIVWAREPEAPTGSGLASAGHGVGKTSFCLLLRYILGDDASAEAITSLREKASGSFPKGGVAAKVHLDGEPWLVFRSYGAYGHSVARRGDAFEQLFAKDAPNEFQAYLVGLQSAFIGRLAAQSLPGTEQPLEWRHLLAWCIREQKTRFDGFFHWREGEGLGFRRWRRDPPLFVRFVLGLLDRDLDDLMRKVEAKQGEVEKLEQSLPELERAPVYALSHAERQLRRTVRADDEDPIFANTTGPSLQSRVEAALAAAKQRELQLEAECEAADDTLFEAQRVLAKLQDAADLASTKRDIAKELADANQQNRARLNELYATLEALTGRRCDHGDIEFSDCDYVQRRKHTASLKRLLDVRELEASAPARAERLAHAQEAFGEATRALTTQTQMLNDLRVRLRRLRVRAATAETDRNLFEKRWDEFSLLHDKRMRGNDSPELVRAREQLATAVHELNGLRTAQAARVSQQSQRAEALKALTRTVATRLLGEAGHGRFVPDSDTRPFDVSKGGEAYQVLEVLLGDLVCLLDSAASSASSHPGFMVHDCPREADMSERLYGDYFHAAAEAASQWADGEAVPFQFIVTTTSAPPHELRKPPAVVLELAPGSEETLLFKRELLPALSGLEGSN